ncbi:MAG: TonB-dependent receptor [bacterium]|jgi:iron complex outermembrane receptor protein|nr:TonB-dependent receptor [Pseudomonadales bacterium]
MLSDWTLTVGGRYSRDAQDFDYDVRTINVLLPSYALDLSEDWSSFDPSLSLRYSLSEDAMIYASYSSGYKSGAFQFFPSTAAAARKVADPEEVDAFELGFKTLLMDQRLQLNMAYFDMDYKDLQLLSLSALKDENGDGVGISAVLIDNAADSTMRVSKLKRKPCYRRTGQWTLDMVTSMRNSTTMRVDPVRISLAISWRDHPKTH